MRRARRLTAGARTRRRTTPRDASESMPRLSSRPRVLIARAAARGRPRGRRALHAFGREQIPGAASRVNEWRTFALVHFLAQTVDVHLDRVRERIMVGVPNVFA